MTTTGPSPASQLSSVEANGWAALLAQLLQSNQPLPGGLEAAAREVAPSRLSRAFAAAAEQLRAGKSLEEVLQGPSRFSRPVRALLVAGVCSTDLAVSLEEVIQLERTARALRRRIVMNLAYPALLMLMLVALFVFFTLAVVPELASMYRDFEVRVPVQTQLWIGVAEGGPWLLIAHLAGVAGLFALVCLFSGVPAVRHTLNRFPLLGPLARWSGLARFVRLLALLIERRVPLAVAVELAGEGSRDADLGDASRVVARRAAAGCPLDQSIQRLPQFPESMQGILRWGQGSGTLPQALRILAQVLEGRVEAQLVLLRMLVPPFTFLIILGGLLTMIAALVLPIVSLIERLT
ncbi:MAG: type II secretion system F family protein [Pirellulales bacterium]